MVLVSAEMYGEGHRNACEGNDLCLLVDIHESNVQGGYLVECISVVTAVPEGRYRVEAGKVLHEVEAYHATRGNVSRQVEDFHPARDDGERLCHHSTVAVSYLVVKIVI